jgi:two-component system cell cycle sensor histidine kinase/response regulator CckA
MHDDPGADEQQPLAGKTVLFAEDEERLRLIVSMMLEELGAEAIAVADGQSALEVYKDRGDRIDIVMLDLRMRGTSGPEALTQLRRIDPAVKVVMVSGYLPDDDILRDLAALHGGFLEKPFHVDRLAEVLVAVLRGETTIPTT